MEAAAEVPFSHSLYFLIYASISTLAGIILIWSYYARLKRDGLPINYTLIVIVFALALAMWTGVGLTEYAYNKNPKNAGMAAFFLGVCFSSFLAWQLYTLVNRIESDKRLIRELATHDSLTGLLNHRMFHETVKNETARAVKFDQPLALILVDVDNMSDLNTAFGHKGGDVVIRELGFRLIDETDPKVDKICRWAGDKIAVIMPQTGAEETRKFAKRLTAIVTDRPIDIGDGKSYLLRLSAGVANTEDGITDPELLIQAAQNMLAAAIESGGDSISFYCEGGKAQPVIHCLSEQSLANSG